MRRIHITESQLIELAKKRMNEDAPLGGTENNSTGNNSQNAGAVSNNVKSDGNGGSIETNNGITKYTLPQNVYDQNKNSQTNLNNAAREMSTKLGVPFKQDGKSFVQGPSTDEHGNQKLDLSAAGTNPTRSAREELSGAGVSVPMDKVNTVTNTKQIAENFITKADIKKARLDRLVSESVPFKKSELFGIVAESDEMYNFKFKDGETYKMQGNKVDDFRKYVFEQDGSLEGREYIIEKIEH